VQRIQALISRLGPLNGLLPRQNFRRNMKVINSLIDRYIERTLRLNPDELAGKGKGDSGYTFLHALAGFTRDRKVLRDQLIAVLLAGRDTTACTLSWTIYELARHPECLRKLREEILSVVGPTRPPTYEDLKSMKYLQNVMNETLRLYPIVPFKYVAPFRSPHSKIVLTNSNLTTACASLSRTRHCRGAAGRTGRSR
jgi:cytochrome P450